MTGANFVGCHQFRFLDKVDVLGRAAPGATLLLNCRLAPEGVWDALPRKVQEQLLEKGITLYVVDADRIARDAMGDDEDGEAIVEDAPMRPNPVTQDEMDAGSIDLF